MSRRPAGDADIVRRLYECLQHDAPESQLLPLLTREFDSTYSAILVRDRLSEGIKVAASDYLPADKKRAYESYYCRLWPPSFFGQVGLTLGKALTDASYESQEAYRRSEIHNEFFRPLDADHLMFVAIDRGALHDKSIVLRRSRQVGFYDPSAAAKLERLAAHLPNLFNLREKLRQSLETKNLSSVLDRLGVAVLVTDRARAIQHVTKAADELLAEGLALNGTKGILRARHVETDKRLHAAIRSCVDSFDHPREATRRWKFRLPISDTDGPSLIATISPLLWCFADRGSAPAALVEITDPRRPHVEEPLELGACFGLTPAETRVAVALCEGYSIGRYAASAGISILTARTLLKRALGKTHTHSQSELVSLFFRHSIRTGDH
jgi:DNA-binding CsgD family transcriptional regulator